MQASADCIPCVLRQALAAARRVTDDPWLHRKLLFAVMEHLPTLDFDRSPAELSFEAVRFVNKYLGVVDPYKEEKELYTKKLLALEHDMRRAVLGADDPLRAAIQFSLAGNAIDLGTLGPAEIEQELARDAMALEFAVDDYEELRAALAEARSLMYILDNAGEVVCDKLVIEQLSVPEISCVVRKAPILNDVTREDIESVGLGRLARIVDPGVEALGVPLSLCSTDFRTLFADSDVVVAKGQANFETLDEAERPVFHVLRAKCDHMADHFHIAKGACVVARTPREAPGSPPADHPDESS